MALNKNLSKNSTDLRRATLRVMNELFSVESFLPAEGNNANVDSDQVRRFYKGDCQIMAKLLEYEKIRLAFETERPREQILRSIEVQISTGLVPAAYVDAVYHLMVGSLWLKFTPGYAAAMSLIQSIIIQAPEVYMSKFLGLFENIGHLTQFTNGDNDSLQAFLLGHASSPRIEAGKGSASIFEEIYLGDSVGSQEYILLKDFHFNLCKTLYPIVDRFLTHKEYKSHLFRLFERFFEHEYLFLHEGRSAQPVSGEAGADDL